ncbi:MAG: hypothetical protein H6714_09050 [Myxococcales bacterium]|nr:hypothetical protein [Myxococcales bacterium]
MVPAFSTALIGFVSVIAVGCSNRVDLPGFANGLTCKELGALEYDPAHTHPADGCMLVSPPGGAWKPFSGTYRPDTSDPSNSQPDNPIFQFQDQQTKERLCIDVELFPRAGTWGGKPGEYDLDCEKGGLCTTLFPDEDHYISTAGKINIVKLPDAVKGEAVDKAPFEINMSGLTLGERGSTCFHIESLTLSGTVIDLSATL